MNVPFRRALVALAALGALTGCKDEKTPEKPRGKQLEVRAVFPKGTNLVGETILLRKDGETLAKFRVEQAGPQITAGPKAGRPYARFNIGADVVLADQDVAFVIERNTVCGESAALNLGSSKPLSPAWEKKMRSSVTRIGEVDLPTPELVRTAVWFAPAEPLAKQVTMKIGATPLVYDKGFDGVGKVPKYVYGLDCQQEQSVTIDGAPHGVLKVPKGKAPKGVIVNQGDGCLATQRVTYSNKVGPNEPTSSKRFIKRGPFVTLQRRDHIAYFLQKPPESVAMKGAASFFSVQRADCSSAEPAE